MVALVGVCLIAYLYFRTGLHGEDYSHFGVWHHAPRWARVLFGSVDGAISPYRLYVQAFGLIWASCGFAWVVTGDPPGQPWRHILASIVVLSLPACLVGLVAVTVGQKVRLWQIDRTEHSELEGDGNSEAQLTPVKRSPRRGRRR